jgi:long-subunit acyl-CoA synthetase (AMP-forming)
MGGRLRLVLSGGAPLSPDTHELIKICLCVKVIQGYGLTETCSSATVMDSKLNSHTFYIIPEVVVVQRNITF